MLAIDLLVGGLLLSSIGVNILALGAFWVTPSLRTTANRFVINLLIVNLVCCIILGPSLLLNAFTAKVTVPSVAPPGSTATSTVRWPLDGADTALPTSVYYVEAISEGDGSATSTTTTRTTTTTVLFQRGGTPQSEGGSSAASTTTTRKPPVRCTKNGTMDGTTGGSSCDSEPPAADDDDDDNETGEETPFIRTSPAHGDALHAELTLTKIRCWGLDLVVALGALSVLLVVGDTWCAITDPLRYHSRISELKAWGFIIATWVLGIAFGIASGFRGDQKHVTLFKNRLTAAEVAAIESSHSWAHNRSGVTPGAAEGGGPGDSSLIQQLNISEDLYNTIFSYAYFVIVILVPFALVCAMYWRIFSEARESGQRMRQNGSSPLLQSALNLASAQKQHLAAAATAATEKQQPHQALEQVPPLASIPERPCERVAPADSEGLTMKIDKQIHYEDETITVSSIPHHHLHHRDSCLKPLLQPTPGTTPTHKVSPPQPPPTTVAPPVAHAHHEPDPRPDRVQIATPTSALRSPLRAHDRNHNSILMALPPLEATASGPIPTGRDPERSSERAASLEDTPGRRGAAAGLGRGVRRNHSAGRLVSFSEQQQQQQQQPPEGLRQVHSTPNFQQYAAGEFESLGQHHILSLPAVHVPPKALSYMTSIRHRLSNASSLFKYREESRAARISILVIIMFLVSYLPYGILVLMQGHVDLIIVSDQALLAIFTVVIANLSSPFIFAYRNKRVRRGVKRLLGIDKKTNERLQKLTSSNTHFNNHSVPGQQQQQQQTQASQQQGNYGANITLAGAACGDGLHSAAEDSGLEEVISEVNGSGCGGGGGHKSHKVRIAGPGGVGAVSLARTNSASCKYLTPNHAAAVAVANGYIVEFERYPSDELNSLCLQKKSILKRVCDSSRKWGCNFATNSCTSNDEQTEV